MLPPRVNLSEKMKRNKEDKKEEEEKESFRHLIYHQFAKRQYTALRLSFSSNCTR